MSYTLQYRQALNRETHDSLLFFLAFVLFFIGVLFLLLVAARIPQAFAQSVLTTPVVSAAASNQANLTGNFLWILPLVGIFAAILYFILSQGEDEKSEDEESFTPRDREFPPRRGKLAYVGVKGGKSQGRRKIRMKKQSASKTPRRIFKHVK